MSFTLITFPLPTPKTGPIGPVFGVWHFFHSIRTQKRTHFSAFFMSSPSPPFKHQLHIHMDALLVFSHYHHPIQALKCAQNGVLLVYSPPSATKMCHFGHILVPTLLPTHFLMKMCCFACFCDFLI